MGDIKEKDKKEEITVSVLVAVYNGEKYLEQCLSSLLAQTLQNVQIICVDDCSTDSSLEILHKYQQIDDRVEVVHLEKNQGQGHARNVALSQAKGEYICFLDSDDTFSADALQSAVAVFENHEKTDSVLFHVVYCNSEGEPTGDYPMNSFEVMPGREAFENSLTWKIHGIYIVRASIHQQYPYDETCRTYSDDNTTRIHFYQSREVRCCDGIYYYRQHPASVTHCVSVSRFDYLKANESMKHQLVSLGVDEDVLNLYENVRWLVVIDLYMFYFKNRGKLSEADRNYGINEIKRVWKGIELSRLNRRYLFKFGYIPFRPFWSLFRIQEELYFALRKLIKKTV